MSRPTITCVEIGGMQFALETSARLARPIRARYAGFCQPAFQASSSRPFRLRAKGREERDAPSLLDIATGRLTPSRGARLRVSGAYRGYMDRGARRGALAGADGLMAADSLLRLALSVCAPEAGWVPLHGAAIRTVRGGFIALVGQSGSGKSTAARAFASLCDECVLLGARDGGVECASTPYWGGRHSETANCRAIICLERGSTGSLRPVARAAAVAALAPHVVRFAHVDDLDRRLFASLCALGRGAVVYRATCPAAADYLPYLRGVLAGAGLEPAPREEAA
jgi:hypothetical protein